MKTMYNSFFFNKSLIFVIEIILKQKANFNKE